MEIDRQRAIKAFQEYTSHYDVADEKVKLKIDRVTVAIAQLDRATAS